MPVLRKTLKPPAGLARWVYRAPIWFYQIGIGWLLGSRFLELTHTGRKTGLPRHTVLEVVRYDPGANIYYIAVGFGKRSDWYQNIMINPNVEVRSAGRFNRAVAVQLTPEEAGDEMVLYSRKHALIFRRFIRLLGYEVDGTEEDTRELGKILLMFALKPAEQV